MVKIAMLGVPVSHQRGLMRKEAAQLLDKAVQSMAAVEANIGQCEVVKECLAQKICGSSWHIRQALTEATKNYYETTGNCNLPYTPINSTLPELVCETASPLTITLYDWVDPFFVMGIVGFLLMEARFARIAAKQETQTYLPLEFLVVGYKITAGKPEITELEKLHKSLDEKITVAKLLGIEIKTENEPHELRCVASWRIPTHPVRFAGENEIYDLNELLTYYHARESKIENRDSVRKSHVGNILFSPSGFRPLKRSAEMEERIKVYVNKKIQEIDEKIAEHRSSHLHRTENASTPRCLGV